MKLSRVGHPAEMLGLPGVCALRFLNPILWGDLMSESSASARFTRLTAWIGLVLEVLAFVGRPLQLAFVESHQGDLEKLGIVLFLISLVTWLEASNKGMTKLDQMSSELRALTEEAKKIDLIARYGSSAVWLARLLNPQGQDVARFPHCRAGGETLSHLLLNTYTQAAEEFYRFRSGEKDKVELSEASIINLFLKNLILSLPRGSVWLGTSKLQDSTAWEERTAEPSYYEFESAVEARIEKSDLTYLRLLCFQDEERYRQMSHILGRQEGKGLRVRVLIQNELPQDISLIWVPKTRLPNEFDFSDPVQFLQKQSSKFEPLCGLSFGIRADREVNQMQLIRPDAEEFSELKRAFRKSWAAARAYANGRIDSDTAQNSTGSN